VIPHPLGVGSFIRQGYNMLLNQNSGADFIFPDKKSLYSLISYDVAENQKAETVIIGNDIYSKYFWFQGWIHVKNDDTIPMPISDMPGEYITYKLDNYMSGWDLTKNIEKIEEDLGVEEIDGRKLRHYKVKMKKPPIDSLNNLNRDERYFLNYILGFNLDDEELTTSSNQDDKDTIEQIEGSIRFTFDNNEVTVPLPEELSVPIMYKFTGVMGEEGKPETWEYNLRTWGIEGEIWVGEDDGLVYKEKYKTEQSMFNHYPNETEDERKEREQYSWEQDQVYKDEIEIIYSDFNGDIKIEAPIENVMEIGEYLKQFGYSSYEEYNKERIMSQVEAADVRRKQDLKRIEDALNSFMNSQVENKKIPPYYPVNNKLEKTNDSLSILQTLIPEHIESLPLDAKDPEYYYTYMSDGFQYELSARLENLEDLDCKITGGICLYIIKGGAPAPDSVEVEKIKERCAGSVFIESEECKNEKAEIKVRVTTAGDCPVSFFIATYSNGENSMAEFSNLGNDFFLVTVDNCKKVEELIASSNGYIINR